MDYSCAYQPVPKLARKINRNLQICVAGVHSRSSIPSSHQPIQSRSQEELKNFLDKTPPIHNAVIIAL